MPSSVDDGPILICYDGSDVAMHAITAAADLLSHRPTVVLDVTPPLTAEEREAAFLSPAIADDIESRVHDVSGIARRGARWARDHGLQAVERVDVATPTWQGVVDVADEIDAAVVVVGSHGLSGAHELLEGSFSHELAEHAARPLLIVPPSG